MAPEESEALLFDLETLLTQTAERKPSSWDGEGLEGQKHYYRGSSYGAYELQYGCALSKTEMTN